jgi:hypothetical protein
MRPHFCTSISRQRPKKKKKKMEKRQRNPTASARTLAPARAAFGPLSGKPA